MCIISMSYLDRPESGITREELVTHLKEQDIGTAIHYPIPIHKQLVYKGKIAGSTVPVSQRISREIISLPVYPDLSIDEPQAVITAIDEVI